VSPVTYALSVMKLAFGDCVLDLAARQLRRAGQLVPLEPKMYTLLQTLIERRPAVVKNEELDEVLWPNVYVARTSLTRLVSELRSVLGDTPRDGKIIRTVYKSGYAFGADVIAVAKPIAGPPVAIFSLLWNDRLLPLVEGTQVVGRGEECQLVIDADTVSRRHARILIDQGTARIEDLGSTNGTHVNGARISAVTELTDGCEIALGSTPLRIKKRDPSKDTVKVSDAERYRLMGLA
jgi:DNA-binding winged helix-turn-helix (wHTH) protein